MDMCLSEAIGERASPSTRPDLTAVLAWLRERCRGDDIVEACIFANVPRGGERQMTPWISTMRHAGFYVFVKPKRGRSDDVDADIARHIRKRHRQGSLVELVVASHDGRAFASDLVEYATNGLKVLVLGYREKDSFAFESDVLEFIDLEELPSVFNRPLPRTNIYDLPPSGVWLAPLGSEDDLAPGRDPSPANGGRDRGTPPSRHAAEAVRPTASNDRPAAEARRVTEAPPAPAPDAGTTATAVQPRPAAEPDVRLPPPPSSAAPDLVYGIHAPFEGAVPDDPATDDHLTVDRSTDAPTDNHLTEHDPAGDPTIDAPTGARASDELHAPAPGPVDIDDDLDQVSDDASPGVADGDGAEAAPRDDTPVADAGPASATAGLPSPTEPTATADDRDAPEPAPPMVEALDDPTRPPSRRDVLAFVARAVARAAALGHDGLTIAETGDMLRKRFPGFGLDVAGIGSVRELVDALELEYGLVLETVGDVHRLTLRIDEAPGDPTATANGSPESAHLAERRLDPIYRAFGTDPARRQP